MSGPRSSPPPDVAHIDACLPQTQCTRCGYPRCLDYAQAIASGEAAINRCPPGGETTLQMLRERTGQTANALDPEVGEFMPRQLAVIEESACIGCVLCIKACPVDAILGANKTLHDVLDDACTGCELCLPVCPTDCIQMRTVRIGPDEVASPWPDYDTGFANRARHNLETRLARLHKAERAPPAQSPGDRQARQAGIQAALARARQSQHKAPQQK